MKNRVIRVCEVLKRELSSYITREIQFEGTLITVNEVDMTPDLKQAHIYISALGKQANKAKILSQLDDHRIAMQAELSRRVALKNTPHLYFYFDESIARGTRVIQLMDDLGLEHSPLPEEEEEQ